MKIPSVKGTRDLYPEDFAPLRRIFDVWRSVSQRHGFEEFEGPTLEMLDLYKEKSGDELVGQLYQLQDSGGRHLALRPEMTPTLARMVAARVTTLAKPVKWFCIPRLFRGENVQRGRLREFFQWNVDVIGTADVAADAECILVGVEAMRELGLGAGDFAVHISHRGVLASLLSSSGIPASGHAGAYALLDKAGKLPEQELKAQWESRYGEQIGHVGLMDLLAASDLPALRSAAGRIAGPTPQVEAALDELERLFQIICNFGITDFCKLDFKIVRGLAYYTGPVFEFLDRAEGERAICGGGRYDDLLGKLGKHPEPAVGFGMGDVVLALMLKDRGLLEVRQAGADAVFVAEAVDGLRENTEKLVAELRRRGLRAEFNYVRQGLGKQLKAANKRGFGQVIILGAETLERGVVRIKDMARGREQDVGLDELLSRPEMFLSKTT